MYINGTEVNEDTPIYYDASGGEMVDIETITVKELIDRGYDQ